MLFTLLAATTIAVLRLRDLFASAMLFGIYSLLAASAFVMLDAVDVAFTEAAVGAGISTILILGALALTGREQSARSRAGVAPTVCVLLTGALLLYGTLDMPHFGRPDAPVHEHVAPRYLNDSMREIGIPNVVTSVLASYRGYDTLGEVTVVFTAGIGVLALIGRIGRRRGDGLPPGPAAGGPGS